MDKKRILISAGGTSESIDSVRSITNHSTGRLGSIIADTFAANGACVTYLCSERAALPQSEDIEIVRIKDVQSLLEAMDRLLCAHKFDCVIHSMAVSDFTPIGSASIDEIVGSALNVLDKHSLTKDKLRDELRSAILSTCTAPKENKISSKSSNLMMLLENTPKVISHIKKIQPDTILVGFKLLSDVTESELLSVAHDLMIKNACDFVLANDLRDICGDLHKAILINRDSILHRANTKHEIAEIIYSAVKGALK